MKKENNNKKSIKDFTLQVYDNKNKKWYSLDYSRIQYTDIETIEREYNFIDFCKEIEEGIGEHHWEHSCFYVTKTLFSKRLQLVENRVFDRKVFDQKDYSNTIKFRIKANDRQHLSIATLMKELDNQDFIEFLKDNNINFQVNQ